MDYLTMNITKAVGWIVISVLIGYWSKLKGRGFWRGFLYSIVFSPVIGLIVVALFSRQN